RIGAFIGNVLGEDVSGQGQVGPAGMGQVRAVRDAAPTVSGVAVRDRQPADGYVHRRGGRDVKDAAGVVAAYSQLVGPWTINGYAVLDQQLAACQLDGAAHAFDEDDGVGAGIGVGVDHRLAERAGAAVKVVGHGNCAGQGAVFQCLQPGAILPAASVRL